MKKLLARCLAVALLVSGFLVMPQNAKAAEGNEAIDQSGTYAIADYWSETTKKAPVKDGYVFAEMEVGVNEEKGTISIVGNTATVNENVIADGIFANIRFVKADGATSDDLDFTITTASFCDWDEKMIENNLFVR